MLKADQADLQSAVKDGRLTTKQESMIEAKLKQHIADFVEHGFRSFGHDNDGDSFQVESEQLARRRQAPRGRLASHVRARPRRVERAHAAMHPARPGP